MTDNRTTELLPCPFCGGEAELIDHFGAGWWVACKRKGCCFIGGDYATEAEAIAAWNSRAERTCHIVKTPSDSDYLDDWRYRCSECGCNIPVNERDPKTGDVINAANYCPNCGRKVIGG